MNPESLGIGLGEDPSLLIKKGTYTICIRSGMVTVIDGVGLLKKHRSRKKLLTDGCRFSIEGRKLTGVPGRRLKAAQA